MAYVVLAWLVMQVADVILNNIAAPDWIFHVLLLFLSVGLVFAVFFSWAFELTPEGLKREHEVDRKQPKSPQTGRKLNLVIVVVLSLALAWFAWDKFITDPRRDQTELESALLDTSQNSGIEATNDISKARLEHSIAVLPFVNMSEDSDNEYFADGMAEELLNMLVKIPELRVAARTSSFSFKGRDLKISEIANELNVSHILEGSVRKSGNKVRITAQLIKADEGFHLWSQTFDRTLDDIFAVQDEIASEVAQALEVTLMGGTQVDREIDPEAYALFLKGLNLMLYGGVEDYSESEKVLLQAIELDPGYGEPWATLAMNYYNQNRFGLIASGEGAALARNAIEQAKRLAPDLAVTWGIDGFLKKNLDWDWRAAQAAINKAHKLEPQSNDIMTWRASMAATIGRLNDAVELYEKVILIDPLGLSTHSALGNAYMKVHRFEDASEIFERQAKLKPDYHWAYFNLGKSWLFRGDANQALVEIKKNPENVYRFTGLVMAYTALGREKEALEALNKLISDYGERYPGWVAEAFSWRGQKDEAFQWLEKAYLQGDSAIAHLLGNNVFYALTDDPRWADFLKKVNLWEYWQAMPDEFGELATSFNPHQSELLETAARHTTIGAGLP